MFLQVRYFLLPCDGQFPDRGDYLYLRREDFEHYVESYLVVAGSRTSVCDIGCTDFLDELQHFESLEHAF